MSMTSWRPTVFFLLLVVARVPIAGAAETRPNILWISAEDLSADLGCYGDTFAKTPNLDRFAGEGVRFTRAFAVAGVCAPSRSSIITGMHPTTIGTNHMRCQGVPPVGVRCFTEHLRAAGYYCTNNSKTDYNFDSPRTAWDESSPKAHWRGRAKGQPFFAVINLITTHESKIRCAPKEFEKLTAALKPEDRHDPASATLPPYYPDTPVVRRDWARYYDLVTAMDRQVGEILEQLKADGLAESTIVFFWGDHGRGLPRGKRWLYDSGLHVPLMVRWPGTIKPGTIRDDLVSLMDLGPTQLSLAGVPAPAMMQGKPFLGEQAATPRQFIYGARDRMDETYDLIRCVRDKRFKYLRNFQPEKPYAQHISYMDRMPTMREMRRLAAEGKLTGPQRLFFAPSKPMEELYDITADPHEINNLAGSPEHRAELERMRGELDRWMKESGDVGLIPEVEWNERVRPGGKWSVTAAPTIELGAANPSGERLATGACATPGVSIAYTFDQGRPVHWKLYTAPLPVPKGQRLRAVACRLGYKDSAEVVAGEK